MSFIKFEKADDDEKFHHHLLVFNKQDDLLGQIYFDVDANMSKFESAGTWGLSMWLSADCAQDIVNKLKEIDTECQ